MTKYMAYKAPRLEHDGVAYAGKGLMATLVSVSIAFIAITILLLLSFVPKAQAAGKGGKELVVSAAASLGGVMDAVVGEWALLYPDVRVSVNLGASGTLQRQIEQGAPVDLLLSASRVNVGALTKKGKVGTGPGDTFTLCGNALVLVRPKADPRVKAWKDLENMGQGLLAIGNPDHVPAGRYGRDTLKSLGLWDNLKGSLVLGEDVTQVLGYVRTGAVAAGLVYSTDAVAARNDVRVVAKAPAGSHEPIEYAGCVLADSANKDLARRFAGYLQGPVGRAILEGLGFTVK